MVRLLHSFVFYIHFILIYVPSFVNKENSFENLYILTLSALFNPTRIN